MAGALAQQRNKLIAAAVIFLAAVTILIFQFRGGGALPSAVTYVCVATGKTYNIDRGRLKWLPLENPDTGQKTLLPCSRRDDGLYVSYRCRDILKDLGDVNKFVDPETLEVLSSPR